MIIEGEGNRRTSKSVYEARIISIRMGGGEGGREKTILFFATGDEGEEIGGRRKTCVIQGRTVAKEGPREMRKGNSKCPSPDPPASPALKKSNYPRRGVFLGSWVSDASSMSINQLYYHPVRRLLSPLVNISRV